VSSSDAPVFSGPSPLPPVMIFPSYRPTASLVLALKSSLVETPTFSQVYDRRNAKPAEVIQVIDVLRGDGNLAADCAREGNDVDSDHRDVSDVRTPVEPDGEVARCACLSGAQVVDFNITLRTM
jgi:hypothetical protein